MEDLNIKNIKKIKNILSILENGGESSLNRIINLSELKFNIEKNDVIQSINLLLELNVIEKRVNEWGDGWNTSYDVYLYSIV